MTVRPAQTSDVETLRSLCRRLGQPEVTDGFLARSDTIVLIAEERGETVGWLYGYELARPDGTSSYLLYSIDVIEEHRRQGHGRRLLDEFLSQAGDAGAHKAWLLTDIDNAAANALYCKAGGEVGHPPARLYVWRLVDDATASVR